MDKHNLWPILDAAPKLNGIYQYIYMVKTFAFGTY